MSDIFTVVAESYEEAIRIATQRYGKNYHVLTHRPLIKGGFFGIGGKPMVEITGVTVPQRPSLAANRDELQRNLQEMKGALAGELFAKNLEQKLKTIVTNALEDHLERSQMTPRNQVELENILRRNDFSPSYIDLLIKDLKRELSLEDWKIMERVQAAALRWIERTIAISPPQEPQRPRIHVLVGATGVGKTTTIGKLAFHLGEYHKGTLLKKIALINLDDYRIGGEASLRKYGEILRVPVYFCPTQEEFQRSLALTTDFDHILIDTYGCNPRDVERLAWMSKHLSTIGERFECLLTISAVTKVQDLETTLDMFRMFSPQDVIVTKVDETLSLGNVISTLWEHRLRIRYITTGQNVPHNFSCATKLAIMKYLVGFSENLIKEFSEERKDA